MQGQVDTRAPNGSTGSLLLDPTSVYIANDQASAAAAGMVGSDQTSSGPTFTPSGAIPDSLVTVASIQGYLSSTNVLVQTTNALGTGAGFIKVVDGVSWTSGNELGLKADNGIQIDAPITGSSGTLSLAGGGGAILQAAAGAGITVTKLWAHSLGGPITLNGSGNNVSNLAAASLGGSISFTTTGDLSIVQGSSSPAQDGGYIAGVQTAGQPISLSATGNITIADISNGVRTFGGSVKLESGGNITQTGAITATDLAIKAIGDVTLDTVANSVTNVAATLGDLGASPSTNKVFRFKNSGALNVGSVGGISGITSMFNDGGYDPMNQNGYISLVAAGPLTQSAGALLGGKAVYAEGTSVNLDQPNWTGVIAGRATGTASGDVFSYKSANPINVNQVAGSYGIQAYGNIKLEAPGIFIDQGIESSFGSLTIGSSKDVRIGGTGVYLDAGANISITAGAGNVDLGNSYSSVYSNSGSVLVKALGVGGSIAGNGSFGTDGGAAGSVTLEASNSIAFDYIETSGYAALDGGAVTLTAGAGVSGAGIYTGGGYGSAGSGGKGGSVTVNGGTSGVSLGYIATYGGGSDSGGGTGGNVSLSTSGTLSVGPIHSAGGDGGLNGAQGGNGGSVTLLGATVNLVPPVFTQTRTAATAESFPSGTSTPSSFTSGICMPGSYTSGICTAGGWGGDNSAGNGGAGGSGGAISIRQTTGNLVLPDISLSSGGGWGGNATLTGSGGTGGTGGNISITADAGNVTFSGALTSLWAPGGNGGTGSVGGSAGMMGQVNVAAKPTSGGVIIASGPVELDGYWNNTTAVSISNSAGIRGWGPFINNGTVSLSDSGFVEAEVFENTSLGTVNVISGTPHANLLRNDGAVNIASGAMLMTPPLSNYGTISGNGTLKVVNVVDGVIGGPGTFDNYGSLKPGGDGAVGALTIDAATANFSSGTNLYLDISSTSSHDVLDVTGDVNLAAAGVTATLNTSAASIVPGDAFNIIQSAAGTMSGTAPPAVSGFSFEVTSGSPQALKAVAAAAPTPAPTTAPPPAPTAAPQTTTTVEKIVEFLGTESSSTVQEVQQAVAELDSSTLNTLDTLLVQEAQTQAVQKAEEIAKKEDEQKAIDEKRRSGAAAEENQCKP
jgi:hypothetical protein